VKARKAISKRLRFEVFKRDSFTCQYCGRSAPDVILHADHINPVAGGGETNILNLITSCLNCNLGKGARELSDDSAIQKQRAQLAELNDRREQLEMMVAWREGLRSIDDDAVGKLEDLFTQLTGRLFSEYGRKKVKGWLRRHEFGELYAAMEDAAQTYWKDPETEEEQSEQAQKVFNYTPGIIAARKRNEHKPWMKDLYYARAILRNRHYCNEHKAIELLEEAYEAGIHVEELKEHAKQSHSWTAWHRSLREWIDEIYEEEGSSDEQD
jgi:hypothetical protein